MGAPDLPAGRIAGPFDADKCDLSKTFATPAAQQVRRIALRNELASIRQFCSATHGIQSRCILEKRQAKSIEHCAFPRTGWTTDREQPCRAQRIASEIDRVCACQGGDVT